MRLRETYAKEFRSFGPIGIITEGYLTINIYNVFDDDELVIWGWADETIVRSSKLRGDKFRIGNQWRSLNDALRIIF